MRCGWIMERNGERDESGKSNAEPQRVLNKAVCSPISGEGWRLEARRPARRPLRQWPIKRVRAVGTEGGVGFRGCLPGGVARLILPCFSLERALVIRTLTPRAPEEGLRTGRGALLSLPAPPSFQ